MSKRMRRMAAGFLAALMLAVPALSMAGCGSEVNYAQGEGGYSTSTRRLSAEGLSGSIPVEEAYCFSGEEEGLTDVSVRLFQECCREDLSAGNNAMISPLSLITALTMTARGAGGETLAQIEAALDSELDYFALYLGNFMESLKGREDQFTSANSIWIRDEEERITVEEQFLADGEAYFQAEVFKSAFDDGTVKDINRWCSENTDGMIDQLVKEIKEEEVIRLLNAICFDAKWQQPYEEWSVREGEFLNAQGDRDRADFMHGKESRYVEDEAVKGFIKPYRSGYSFVGLVPKAGVIMYDGVYPDQPGQPMSGGETYGEYTGQLTGEALSDYVESLNGDKLRKLLDSQTSALVRTRLPVFTGEYTADLIPALRALGIEDLFDEGAADLSSMATSANGNIFISKVTQKTFIEVDTEGTRAAAVTEVVAADSGAMEIPEYKEVYLDRPFLYMIIDDATGVPIFMGTVMNMDSRG